MKTYLESACFLAIMISGLSIPAAHAEVPLFNFTLNVEGISNPQIFLGKNKKIIKESAPNTFNVPVGKSDYVFFVQYQERGQMKEVRCPISGAPTLVTATIDPTKPSGEACMTQESNHKTGIVAL